MNGIRKQSQSIKEPHQVGFSSSIPPIQRRRKNEPRPANFESANSSLAPLHDGTLYHSDKFQSLQSARTQECDDSVSSSKWRARYRASRTKAKSPPHQDGPSEHSTRSNRSCETDCTVISSSSSSVDSTNRRALLREIRIHHTERKPSTEMSCGRELSSFEDMVHVKRRPAKTSLNDRLHASLSQLDESSDMEPHNKFKNRLFNGSMPNMEKVLEGISSDNDYDHFHYSSSSSSEQLTHRQMMDVQDMLNDEHTLVFLMSEEIQRLDKERTETVTSRHLMEISEEFGIPIAYTAGRGLELVPKKLSEIKAIAAFIQHHTGKIRD